MDILRLLNVLISCADTVIYIEFICFLLHKNKKSILNKLGALAVVPFLIWSSAMIFFNAEQSKRGTLCYGLMRRLLGGAAFLCLCSFFSWNLPAMPRFLKNRCYAPLVLCLPSIVSSSNGPGN